MICSSGTRVFREEKGKEEEEERCERTLLEQER